MCFHRTPRFWTNRVHGYFDRFRSLHAAVRIPSRGARAIAAPRQHPRFRHGVSYGSGLPRAWFDESTQTVAEERQGSNSPRAAWDDGFSPTLLRGAHSICHESPMRSSRVVLPGNVRRAVISRSEGMIRSRSLRLQSTSIEELFFGNWCEFTGQVMDIWTH
jgi:hypothetical protein